MKRRLIKKLFFVFTLILVLSAPIMIVIYQQEIPKNRVTGKEARTAYGILKAKHYKILGFNVKSNDMNGATDAKLMEVEFTVIRPPVSIFKKVKTENARFTFVNGKVYEGYLETDYSEKPIQFVAPGKEE